jgi:hypothetical protein
MSIFSANEIRTYIVSQGVQYNEADAMQTLVLQLEADGAFSAKDSSIIKALDLYSRNYGFKFGGLGLYENSPSVWDNLYTGQPQPVSFNDFRDTFEAMIRGLTKYMRHFAGLEY